MLDAEKYKQQLVERKADLQKRLVAIEHELDSHQSKDWEELATEREEDEVLEGLGDQGLQELRQIELALSKIEAGTYGECVKCGDEISAERLDLLPHAPLCRVCAAKA